VMARYLHEYAPTRPSATWIADMAEHVLTWWSDKTLADVNGRNCRTYLDWRMAQPIRSFKKIKPKKVGMQLLDTSFRYYGRPSDITIASMAHSLRCRSSPCRRKILLGQTTSGPGTRQHGASELLVSGLRRTISFG
jgi:hypothetical protein